MTDNRTEFKNSVMETLCQNLNIKHIFTSTYHPEGNDRVGHYYRVGVSGSTRYAPFFLLYTRDPVLPLDNRLRPRRKYLSDQHHQLALERQHEAFVKVRHNLQQARRKQAFYNDKRARDKEYEVVTRCISTTINVRVSWKNVGRVTTALSPNIVLIPTRLNTNLQAM